LPPREIELTVRLEIPDGEGVDVSIRPEFKPSLPPVWEDILLQRLYQGVHVGLANVGDPIPSGGINVEVTRLRVTPQLEPSSASNSDDVRRLGDTLEVLTASTVAALWAGLISIGRSTAA
jgi:hypothetical protein